MGAQFIGPSLVVQQYYVPFAFKFCTNPLLVQWALVRWMHRFIINRGHHYANEGNITPRSRKNVCDVCGGW